MPALKLLNLLALASVAILALSSAPVHVNALAADRAQVARHVRGHDAVAKRKRSDASSSSASGRCKPRPSSSLPPTSTPAPTSTTPPPASTTSSAPPASTSAASTSTKWGLAWGADNQYLDNFTGLSKVGYAYTWNPTTPPVAANIVAVPMLWGYDQIGQFQSTVVPGYASHVLGMNEPNEPSQSNMSPQDGYNMWMQYILPLRASGYYLVSPACTDDDAGLQWYQQFFALCDADQNCHVDAIAFHAYTTNAADLIAYATTLYNTYNRPIWITEFADQNFSGTGGQATMDQIWDFAGQVVEFVDNTSWLEAAFPFGLMNDLQGVNTDNSLLTSTGTPTDLAYYYFS